MPLSVMPPRSVELSSRASKGVDDSSVELSSRPLREMLSSSVDESSVEDSSVVDSSFEDSSSKTDSIPARPRTRGVTDVLVSVELMPNWPHELPCWARAVHHSDSGSVEPGVSGMSLSDVFQQDRADGQSPKGGAANAEVAQGDAKAVEVVVDALVHQHLAQGHALQRCHRIAAAGQDLAPPPATRGPGGGAERRRAAGRWGEAEVQLGKGDLVEVLRCRCQPRVLAARVAGDGRKGQVLQQDLPYRRR